jgi:hypothetical protein
VRTWMILRSAMFGVSSECRSRCPLSGHVRCPLASHFSIHLRSYVWPVATMTGSLITSMLIGQQKFAGGAALSAVVRSSRCSSLSFAAPVGVSGACATLQSSCCCPRSCLMLTCLKGASTSCPPASNTPTSGAQSCSPSARLADSACLGSIKLVWAVPEPAGIVEGR